MSDQEYGFRIVIVRSKIDSDGNLSEDEGDCSVISDTTVKESDITQTDLVSVVTKAIFENI